MPFISYAQNFEDIMLWRALKHVQNGFYIDVGANDPNVDSVTRVFYERGWHGINIEPMEQYLARLAAERPLDINLAVAVGQTAGELTFYDVADTGLSTMDADIASRYEASGKLVTPRPVPIMRLDEVCRRYAPGEIHFLKIDVEGFEEQVLRGMDFDKWRPWILVIEATRPQSPTRSNGTWRHIVIEAGYVDAYFDGLNDYYVSQEHPELMESFSVPPNFFDGFTLRSGHHYSYPLTDLEHSLWQANVRASAAEKRVDETEAWGRGLELTVVQLNARIALLVANQVESESRIRYENKRAHQAILQLGIEKGRRLDVEKSLAEINMLYTATQQEIMSTRQADTNEAVLLLRSETERRILLEQSLHAADTMLSAMYASTSWRITAPMRIAKSAVINPKRTVPPIKSNVRSFAVKVARRVMYEIKKHPEVVRTVKRTLGYFPGAEQKLRNLGGRLRQSESTSSLEPIDPPMHVRLSETSLQRPDLPALVQIMSARLRGALDSQGKRSIPQSPDGDHSSSR